MCKPKATPKYRAGIYKRAMDYLTIKEAKIEAKTARKSVTTEAQDKLDRQNPNYHSYYKQAFVNQDSYHTTTERVFHVEISEEKNHFEPGAGRGSLLDDDDIAITQLFEKGPSINDVGNREGGRGQKLVKIANR